MNFLKEIRNINFIFLLYVDLQVSLIILWLAYISSFELPLLNRDIFIASLVDYDCLAYESSIYIQYLLNSAIPSNAADSYTFHIYQDFYEPHPRKDTLSSWEEEYEVQNFNIYKILGI